MANRDDNDKFGGNKFGDRFGNRNGNGMRRDRNDSNLLADSDTECDPSLANFTTNKNFYDLSQQTRHSPEEVKSYYDEEQIAITNANTFAPFVGFNDFNWPRLAVELFRKNNYDKPTPIQAICWPIALSGRDLIGIAVTGKFFKFINIINQFY